MTFDKKKSHALAVGLLYPSALGAGIAWWVQAFLKRSVDGAPHAPLWVLAFGLFFLLYHARQFVTQTSKWEDKPPSQYEERDFASDLIDCTALILAFVCLRLPSEDYLCVDVFGVYALAALIPVGAIITQAKKPTRGTWKTRDNWDTWFLRAIAAVVALVGLGATLWNSGWDRRGVEHRVTGPDLWVPIALWLLLGGYLFFGAWYRGKEPRGTNLPWRARVIGSGALALMVFAVIVYRTGKCGERNPIGELKSIPAGEVYGFAPGRACSMAPAIRAQMKAVVDSLLKLRPSRVLVVGSADTSPLEPASQAIYGNNAGLARSRVNCVAGWLATTSELAGMVFTPDVDGPKNLTRADRKDRGVLVLALVP